MSAEYIFYSSIKSFKVKSDLVGQTKAVLPLNDFHVWFGFADGNWVLYDALNDKKLNEGKIKGNAHKHQTLFRCPRVLDANTIVYVNSDLLTLQGLNPYTGESCPGWFHEAPTLECLPKESRIDSAKVDKAFVGFDIQVLKNSRMVAVLERKDNLKGSADYLVSVFAENKNERVLQMNREAKGSLMKLGKANEDDLLILYPTEQIGLEYYVLKVSDKESGLQKITLKTEKSCSLIGVSPWGDQEVIFFGNPDEGGSPVQFISNYQTQNTECLPLKCNSHDTAALLRSILHVDQASRRVLLKESSRRGTTIGIWAGDTNQVQFAREQGTVRDVAASVDGTYFIEYEGNQKGETSTMKFVLNRLVTKKIFLLHFMKDAVYKRQPLVNLHGKVDVLRDIANML